jgi:hypothetical protein
MKKLLIIISIIIAFNNVQSQGIIPSENWTKSLIDKFV